MTPDKMMTVNAMQRKQLARPTWMEKTKSLLFKIHAFKKSFRNERLVVPEPRKVQFHPIGEITIDRVR